MCCFAYNSTLWTKRLPTKLQRMWKLRAQKKRVEKRKHNVRSLCCYKMYDVKRYNIFFATILLLQLRNVLSFIRHLSEISFTYFFSWMKPSAWKVVQNVSFSASPFLHAISFKKNFTWIYMKVAHIRRFACLHVCISSLWGSLWGIPFQFAFGKKLKRMEWFGKFTLKYK